MPSQLLIGDGSATLYWTARSCSGDAPRLDSVSMTLLPPPTSELTRSPSACVAVTRSSDTSIDVI
jgi:hypothetical protein